MMVLISSFDMLICSLFIPSMLCKSPVEAVLWLVNLFRTCRLWLYSSRIYLYGVPKEQTGFNPPSGIHLYIRLRYVF